MRLDNKDVHANANNTIKDKLKNTFIILISVKFKNIITTFIFVIMKTRHDQTQKHTSTLYIQRQNL
jgi:hypothetical protein